MPREERHQPGFLGQLYLLMWKNMLKRRRNIKMTVSEVILPVAGGFLLMLLRGLIDLKDIKTPTIYQGRKLSMEAVGKILITNREPSFVLYAPNTGLVKSLINEINSTYRTDYNKGKVLTSIVIFLGFPSESELLRIYRQQEKRLKLIPFALVFDVDDSVTAWPAKVTYTIRPKEGEQKWKTDSIFETAQDLEPREVSPDMYYEHGFLYLQKAVDLAIIKSWQPSPSINTSDWFINRIPFPPYIQDPIDLFIANLFHFIAMLSLLMSVVVMTKSIVYEKENQLKLDYDNIVHRLLSIIGGVSSGDPARSTVMDNLEVLPNIHLDENDAPGSQTVYWRMYSPQQSFKIEMNK